MTDFKTVVERHEDGYVAYPLGLKGVVVGEGDTFEAALADVKSAIRFHLDPSNRHRSHESTKDTKPKGAEGQGSVSFYFVSSWLSISGLGLDTFS